MTLRIVDVQQSILKKNSVLADRLRESFRANGTLVINLLSSPGSGKTTLLERTLEHFAPQFRIAVLVGDQATDNDAVRLQHSGVPVRQITTGAECRLDAQMVTKALDEWQLDPPELLCIENVGNLICPAEYDLGEDLRIALFSVTEGEDKPLKYPLAFNTSHLVIITKTDLAPHTEFDRAKAIENINRVHPGVEILELSSRTSSGMNAWFDALRDRVIAKRHLEVSNPISSS
jgi:hydrogenase nickel incorporation protein HypB